MNLSAMLAEDRIVKIYTRSKIDVLNEIVDVMATSPNVTDRGAFLKAILDREKDLSTGIGQGLAIPHAKIPSIKDFTLTLGISRDGIDFESFDGQPAHFVMMIAASDRQSKDYIKVLAKIVNFFKVEENQAKILGAQSNAEILDLFTEY